MLRLVSSSRSPTGSTFAARTRARSSSRRSVDVGTDRHLHVASARQRIRWNGWSPLRPLLRPLPPVVPMTPCPEVDGLKTVHSGRQGERNAFPGNEERVDIESQD